MKVDEPAIDLGIVSAMASSFLDRPIAAGTVVFGEVGLTGEIRGISQTEVRIREAARMGFTRCILPRTQTRECLPRDADRTDPDRLPEGTDGSSFLTASNSKIFVRSSLDREKLMHMIWPICYEDIR